MDEWVELFALQGDLHQVEVGTDPVTGRQYTVFRVVAPEGQAATDPAWARDVVPRRVLLTVAVPEDLEQADG